MACTGKRPPPDLARRNPTSWLADREPLVTTCVVGRDVHGVERSEPMNYRVIAHVIRQTPGMRTFLRDGR